ncbi:hypothetical protein EJ04DRAFT_599831 [Polyplosphaeria fusca]|uniref:Uncharacterized protein n=1 Tax=Polyplosphaeria fusca TaxID=682080 RepID=A0A9P4UTT7_9PLEO|nr:hypothetical protein EJ04DRAFT_599831 [Polyplosphaeria fusca]
MHRERKRRQHGKALPDPNSEGNHGGAKFWSPKKVSRARDQLAQQEADKLFHQQQKEEETLRRQHAKEEKAVLQEERRRDALATRQRRAELKEQEQQGKADAKALKLQMKNDILVAKKGKAHKTDITSPNASSAASSATRVEEQVAVEVGSVAHQSKTRTRQTKRPARYNS